MTTTEHTLSNSKSSKGKFQTGNVITLFGAHFIHDTYSAFVAPLLPLIMEKLSLSLTLVGTLTAILQVPSIINPFIGYFADKVNLKYFVILTPAITATLISCLGIAPNFLSLAIILFISGLSIAAFHAPAPAIVGHISGSRIGKGMSIFMAGGELGRTLGPLLVIWAVSIWTLEGLLRIAVLGWAASIILFWRLRKVSGKTDQSGDVRLLIPKLKSLYLPLGIILFLRQFILVSITTYLPTFLKSEGHSLFVAGASLSILEMAGVVGALLSGTLSDRVGRKKMLVLAISSSSLLLLFFLNVQGWMSIPLLLMIGFTSLSTGPVYLALVQDNTPSNRAIGNGIYMSLSFLLRSLVLLLMGIAGDLTGLRTAYYVGVFLSFASIPFIFLLPKDKNSNQEQ
jgi:FSR family fosmidomycin resistance protein-like MFS transporter